MSERDLAGFHQFLFRFPSLGLAHELGREIRDAVRELPIISLGAKSWYRGLEQKQKPKFSDFLPPDPQKVEVPEQRFNHQGERVFYLADTPRGAALECRESQDSVWVQRIGIAHAERILDLRKPSESKAGPHTNQPFPTPILPVDLLVLAATYCGPSEPVCRPQNLKPEYRVPRFLAECARERGAHGLLVPSTKQGTNLVLFAWRDEDVSAEGEPEQICF